ncbi:hypothetical protein DUNSADRAFT_2511 [Dunaliella salina]|uniref:Encoded protein n=1 Tax=Dunaliella salina TaxID=3046 RepID=A0ABQ7GVL0_DUNSA|nr:hypothetical protein DUNSADRAFT_2511 [Dunaliella salina]|eukprot:KAF5838602.1 hypothetical protein DUNSADRAFT_2511 [Dunaliella salina]
MHAHAHAHDKSDTTWASCSCKKGCVGGKSQEPSAPRLVPFGLGLQQFPLLHHFDITSAHLHKSGMTSFLYTCTRIMLQEGGSRTQCFMIGQTTWWFGLSLSALWRTAPTCLQPAAARVELVVVDSALCTLQPMGADAILEPLSSHKAVLGEQATDFQQSGEWRAVREVMPPFGLALALEVRAGPIPVTPCHR